MPELLELPEVCLTTLARTAPGNPARLSGMRRHRPFRKISGGESDVHDGAVENRHQLGDPQHAAARIEPVAAVPVRLHHIVVDARDLPAPARFWTKALGWKVLSER